MAAGEIPGSNRGGGILLYLLGEASSMFAVLPCDDMF